MPEEEWIVVDGTHEAIIDQKTWNTAQDKLTAPMLNELLDRIEDGRKETVDGVKRQGIRIVYKQFCYGEFEDLWDFPVTDKERTTLVQAAV